ncbi:MAG TPA: type IV toxin-antitoxin system AbiEi family antitoxin domain-containing protein [Ilumatobacter sp.]|nr:type IV toxin-antitoxin system AbiEi family antitoxin domain-containing protein [Ilumatobacter sp.]
MPYLSTTLAGVVAARHGIVTADQLLTDGLTTSSVRRLVEAGTLLRCHLGVYRVATSPDTFEARCAAASAADQSIVVTGAAGARLWAFRHVFRPELPIVLVEHGRQPVSGPLIIRRTNVLTPEDWTMRPDGIRVASPPRAWFDCARDLDDVRFERLTEWVLDHHAGVPTLWRMRRRLSGSGRVGLARVNRVLSSRSAWQRPAGSGLELRVFKALEQHGVRGLVRQHPIRLSDGITIHPDVALPDVKWALEVDHVTWHGGRLDAQRDKGRDRQLRRIGWQVDRVTDVELNTAFTSTISEVVELIRLRQATCVDFVRR